MVTDYRVVAGVGAPAVVVVHDHSGPQSSVQALCDALAGIGLTVVALGDVGSTVDAAPARSRITDAVRDLRRSDAMAPRISGLGLGAGAMHVLALAAAGLFDSVVTYGTAADLQVDLPCPVLAHPGGPDDPLDADETWSATAAFLTGR